MRQFVLMLMLKGTGKLLVWRNAAFRQYQIRDLHRNDRGTDNDGLQPRLRSSEGDGRWATREIHSIFPFAPM
jgi:hypothetical protein